MLRIKLAQKSKRQLSLFRRLHSLGSKSVFAIYTSLCIRYAMKLKCHFWSLVTPLTNSPNSLLDAKFVIYLGCAILLAANQHSAFKIRFQPISAKLSQMMNLVAPTKPRGEIAQVRHLPFVRIRLWTGKIPRKSVSLAQGFLTGGKFYLPRG